MILFTTLDLSVIIYVNLGYTISLINRKFLKKILLHIIIKKIKVSINVRDIGAVRYVIDKYYLINLYIPGVTYRKKSITYIRREVYIVDDLKVKILIRVDILSPERISIDINKEKLLIRSCNNLTTDIKIKAKDNVDVHRHVRNQKKVILLS